MLSEILCFGQHDGERRVAMTPRDGSLFMTFTVMTRIDSMRLKDEYLRVRIGYYAWGMHCW
jgi:hypothetical protein